MEDEKLKKHFKVQLTDKRKEFNAADIKVKYEQLIVVLKKKQDLSEMIHFKWVKYFFQSRKVEIKI